MREGLVISGSTLIVMAILLVLISQYVTTNRQATYVDDWEFVTSRVATDDFAVSLLPNIYRLTASGGNQFSGSVEPYTDITDSHGYRLYRLNILWVILESSYYYFEIFDSDNYQFTTFGVGNLTDFNITIEEKTSYYEYTYALIDPYTRTSLFVIGLAVIMVGLVLLVSGLISKQELHSKPSLPPA